MIGEKVSLVAGTVAPPLTVSTIIAAVESSPHVNWLTQISEYLPNDPGLRAALFASGLFEFAFTYGFRKSLPPSRIYDISRIGLGIAGLSLSVTAITDPHTLIHEIAAGTTFTAAPASIAATGGDMIAKSQKAFGIYSVIVAFGAAATLASGLFTGHFLTGLTETIATADMGAWVTGSSIWALITDRVRDLPAPPEK